MLKHSNYPNQTRTCETKQIYAYDNYPVTTKVFKEMVGQFQSYPNIGAQHRLSYHAVLILQNR
jgi:hypothetical protein